MLRVIKSLFGRARQDSFDPEEYERLEKAMHRAGLVEGKHYTKWVDCVKKLKRESKHQEAIILLLQLVDAVEKESTVGGKSYGGIAPWYYEQLAILYRKEKLHQEEVDILERYFRICKEQGFEPSELGGRLEKARLLNEASR